MNVYPVLKFALKDEEYARIIPSKPILNKSILGFKSSSQDEKDFKAATYEYEKAIEESNNFNFLRKTLDFNKYKLNIHSARCNSIYCRPNVLHKKSTYSKSKAKETFYQLIKEHFPNKIIDYYTLGEFKNEEKPYWTDFVYHDSVKNILIDIEIDHPYDLIYTENKAFVDTRNTIRENDERDTYFINRGWFVIRFSEEQVVKYPASCCKFIGELLFKLTFNFSYISEYIETPSLPEMPMWSTKQSREMAAVKSRDMYLSNNLFNTRKTIELSQTDKLNYKIQYDDNHNTIEKISIYDRVSNLIEELKYDIRQHPTDMLRRNYENGKIVDEVAYVFKSKNLVIPTINEITTYEYKNNVLRSTRHYYKSEDPKVYYYWFDENDNLIYEYLEVGENIKPVFKKYYDKNLIQKWVTYNNGQIESYSLYSYDESSNLIKVEQFNINNVSEGFITYEYNNKKQLIQENLNLKSEKTVRFYKYDECGNLIEKKSLGAHSSTETFKYNSNNLIVFQSSLYNKTLREIKTRYEYLYYSEEIINEE